MSLECLEGRALMAAVGVPGGLVSWWTGDNTAADLKGLNNAILYSGTTYAAGEVGKAFKFDGVDDRVQVADSDSLKLTGSLTFEAWVRVDSLPSYSGVILFRGDDRGGFDPYQLAVDASGNLFFLVNDAANAGASVRAPISLG